MTWCPWRLSWSSKSDVWIFSSSEADKKPARVVDIPFVVSGSLEGMCTKDAWTEASGDDLICQTTLVVNLISFPELIHISKGYTPASLMWPPQKLARCWNRDFQSPTRMRWDVGYHRGQAELE
jgi:hypothetical protein